MKIFNKGLILPAPLHFYIHWRSSIGVKFWWWWWWWWCWWWCVACRHCGSGQSAGMCRIYVYIYIYTVYLHVSCQSHVEDRKLHMTSTPDAARKSPWFFAKAAWSRITCIAPSSWLALHSRRKAIFLSRKQMESASVDKGGKVERYWKSGANMREPKKTGVQQQESGCNNHTIAGSQPTRILLHPLRPFFWLLKQPIKARIHAEKLPWKGNEQQIQFCSPNLCPLNPAWRLRSWPRGPATGSSYSQSWLNTSSETKMRGEQPGNHQENHGLNG